MTVHDVPNHMCPCYPILSYLGGSNPQCREGPNSEPVPLMGHAQSIHRKIQSQTRDERPSALLANVTPSCHRLSTCARTALASAGISRAESRGGLGTVTSCR